MNDGNTQVLLSFVTGHSSSAIRVTSFFRAFLSSALRPALQGPETLQGRGKGAQGPEGCFSDLFFVPACRRQVFSSIS